METKSIDEILNKSEPATREAPDKPVVSEPSEKDIGQPRDDVGRFASTKPPEPSPEKPTGEAAAPPAAPTVQAPTQAPDGYVPIAALVDTRFEARQAKQEAAELRRRLDEFEKAKNAQPVDFFADPEAALRQSLSPFEARQEASERKLTLRASRAEAIAGHGREAVNKMEAAVGAAMEAGDPQVTQMLRAQMLASDDPVGVAMAWYENRPENLREKHRAEFLAEQAAQANGGKPAQQPAVALPVMPSNLAGARNVGARSGPVWSGPAPVKDIFDRKRAPRT